MGDQLLQNITRIGMSRGYVTVEDLHQVYAGNVSLYKSRIDRLVMEGEFLPPSSPNGTMIWKYARIRQSNFEDEKKRFEEVSNRDKPISIIVRENVIKNKKKFEDINNRP